MLKRSFKRSFIFFPLTIAYMLFSTYIWLPLPLIVPPTSQGFFDNTECAIITLIIAACCFILPDKFEIELGLVNGMSTAKMFFCKALPLFIYITIPMYIFLYFYKYIPYADNGKPRIPIYVPENFKVYIAISFFVTLFFFFALFLFARVITRNCYIPIFICMFFNSTFYDLYKGIQDGSKSVLYNLVCPFISATMLGDTIPNAYAEQVEGMELLRNAWTYNRIGFFVIGVILLVVTYLLLRREKLHRGFGD